MRCIGIAAFSALLCLSAPAQAELLVNISKSQQRLSVTIDGAEAFRWPVSTGTRGHETPSGNFRPTRLERHWYSRQYSMTPMPWAVFFHRGYAVHATTEVYNLGHAASHGCVRLRADNASILYSLVRRQGLRNTKVAVINGPLPALPGTAPTADAKMASNAEEQFAEALADVEEQNLSAKVHPDAGAPRLADAVIHHVSVASNEAQVLREREAWLHSLDRKYGITR